MLYGFRRAGEALGDNVNFVVSLLGVVTSERFWVQNDGVVGLLCALEANVVHIRVLLRVIGYVVHLEDPRPSLGVFLCPRR